jgi:hypothetical protein
MQSQSQEQALAQQRLAAEWAMNQSNLWNQAQQQRQAGLGGLLSTALNYPIAALSDNMGVAVGYVGGRTASSAREQIT